MRKRIAGKTVSVLLHRVPICVHLRLMCTECFRLKWCPLTAAAAPPRLHASMQQAAYTTYVDLPPRLREHSMHTYTCNQTYIYLYMYNIYIYTYVYIYTIYIYIAAYRRVIELADQKTSLNALPLTNVCTVVAIRL